MKHYCGQKMLRHIHPLFSKPQNQSKTDSIMKTNRKLIHIYLLGVMLRQAATVGAQPVTKIAAGGSQSFFLKSGGSLWVIGLTDYGQLGENPTPQTTLPEKIRGTNVTAIAAGIHRTLFPKNDGSLWVMGDN